jgi:hypothetical protein
MVKDLSGCMEKLHETSNVPCAKVLRTQICQSERQIEEDGGLQTGGFDKWKRAGKDCAEPKVYAHGK